MIQYPKTIQEARKYRYHQWAGRPAGTPYREDHCVYEVWAQGQMIMSYQCSRKNGFGPDHLYCKQHSKLI